MPSLARRLAAPALALLLVIGCNDSTGPGPDPLLPAEQRVVSVAGAFQSLCAITANRLTWCLGENRAGEFGNGTPGGSGSTIAVPGATGRPLVTLFGSQGNPRLCGLDADSAAYCWGYNLNGEVGDGTMQTRLVPTLVRGGHRWRTLATSYHTCGVAVDGRGYCWGSTLGGQLGIGPTSANWVLEPAPVATAERFETIVTGMQFSCGLTTTHAALCWGWGMALGDGGPIDRSIDAPVQVSGGHTFLRISAASEHVCALDGSGAPWCWGRTSDTAYAGSRPQPVAVPTTLRFTDVVAGSGFGGCGLLASGEAQCWIATGGLKAVPGDHRWASVVHVNGTYHGVTPGGAVWSWTWRSNGGRALFLTSPTRVEMAPAGIAQ